MSTARKHLFERLPEIYRIRDAEQSPLVNWRLTWG